MTFRLPLTIVLYDDPYTVGFSLEEVCAYLHSLFPTAEIKTKGEVVREGLSALSEAERQKVLEELAYRFAKARVLNPDKRLEDREPSYGERNYELRRLTRRGEASGIIYDGWEFQAITADFLGKDRGSPSRPVVCFTNQLVATYDEGDRRYHLRTVLLGFPTIVSLPGLSEAPAKPREFYLLRDQLIASGLTFSSDALLVPFQDRCLLPRDARLTEVAKGYALQGIFYCLFNEAFCPDPDCRLYNAHWQEEMLHAQLNGSYDLCPRHTQMILSLSADKGGKATEWQA
ncbi:MAG: hypothetical protein NZ959_00030 [Armatimonadetes bacterium]|nr:hypothetical protein [Armatimonadota bacterium]MDW8120700.1 hypothetical protein [Armatimonadota bacterium]